MRTVLDLNLAVSQDANQTQKLLDIAYGFDIREATASVYQSSHLAVPVSTTDQAIAFGGITTASLVVLKAETALKVKINGSGNSAILMAPATDANGDDVPGFLVFRGAITSLHVTNESLTVPVSLFVALIGV